MDIPQTSLDPCVSPPIPPGCTIVPSAETYRLQTFVAIVNLPATTQGYYAEWTDGSRNNDADGDRLVYSFGRPYNVAALPTTFTPPPAGVIYAAGYTPTTPLGTAGGNYASINPNTGIAKFWVTGLIGDKYVVAV
nr:hypothetical protein [Tanacetum cinerariifolium]